MTKEFLSYFKLLGNYTSGAIDTINQVYQIPISINVFLV